MAHGTFGLRGKSLLALLLALLLAALPAGLVGWQLLEGVRDYFGAAFASNATLLNRERILAPLARELALSQRFADMAVVREFLADRDDPQLRQRVFREAEGVRALLQDRALFLIDRASGEYYYNEAGRAFSAAPRYRVEPDDPEDAWFFAMMQVSEPYNLNVNYDAKLGSTRIWINVLVQEAGAPIGLAGASLDLSGFLERFLGDADAGVTPMIIDAAGAIQAHPQRSRIALNSAGAVVDREQTVFAMVPEARESSLREALQRSRDAPGQAILLTLPLDGRSQLLAIGYIPELQWHLITAVDLRAAAVLGAGWAGPALGALALLVLLLLAGFAWLMERWVLRPLRQLQRSAHAVAEGHYEVDLDLARRDEVGELGRAFAGMAGKVRRHTLELEYKVRERTAALEASHAQILQAHRKIDDSIDYASLIQRALLPDRELAELLGNHQYVLWRPRDVVGGDFYVCRGDRQGFLLGVMDCAGHGVPGALMTMLARSALDHAMAELGLCDPAALLDRTDATLHQLLATAQMPRALATNTDAGLVYLDPQAAEMVFAGAAIDLFVSDGQCVEQLQGSRRALGDRRRGEYRNLRLPLRREQICCLVTDGLLDQAGGEHGFGFGSGRFRDWLRTHAQQPLPAQAASLGALLAAWQGSHPQRDDITVLSFRLDPL
jgi:serine phosphatase RsbU (regulator of sigma subunit)